MNVQHIQGFFWSKVCIILATLSIGIALGLSLSSETQRLMHDNAQLATQLDALQELLDVQTHQADKNRKVLRGWQRNYRKLEKRFKENEHALQLAQESASCDIISMPDVMMKQLQSSPYSALQ